MGWNSVGIRLSFLSAFCLLWLNHGHVNASGQSDPIAIPKIPTKPEDTTAALAQHILEKLYENRHEPFLKELGKLLGTKELSSKEQNLGADLIRAFESKDNMRRYMIEYIMNEMSFQTIAVGVNGKTKTVVIAGNIKAFDFWNLAAKVKNKKLRITRVAITDVGFRTSDYKIIQDIVVQEYPSHKVVIVAPSDQDLDNAVKDIQDTKGMDRETLELREKAQAFYAEMQVQHYFEHYEGILGGHEVTIVASKQYCSNCWDSLKHKGIDVVEMEGKKYSASNMRWKEPTELNILHSERLPDTIEVDPRTTETIRDIEILQESGGACLSARSAYISAGGCGCRSLDDFTQVDADEFHNQIKRLSTEDRQRLLFALERTGRNKLSGSLAAMTGILSYWNRWKITIAHGVLQAVRQGTIVVDYLRGSTRTFEPERTAISPSILAESLNQLHEREVEAFADEHRRYQNGELEEGRKSFKAEEMRYKVVKNINLAMVGKNLIGAALEGNWVAIGEVAGLFAADRVLDKAGTWMVARGTKLFEAGEKVLGTTLKIAGPVVGGATLGFGIYCLVSDINSLKYVDKICQGNNHTIMPDGSKNTCNFDHAIEVANIVGDSFSVGAGVVLIVEGVLAALSVSTGPFALIVAALEVYTAILTQIYAAVETVAKINSQIVGGLTGWEKLLTGVKAFLQMGLPPSIQLLLDTKKGYNIDVKQAEEILKQMEDFQTYVGPTTHTRSNIHEGSGLKREFEENSLVDLREPQAVNRFRVEPDPPEWGTLECKPNSRAYGSREPNDPEYAGISSELLCHNSITLTAPNRPDLPVLVNLKNGTDTMHGFTHRKHVFLVEQGDKTFNGGEADDVFLMKSGQTCGWFDGAGGMNTFVLQYDEEPAASPLAVDPPTDYTIAKGCLYVMNFQRLVGRANKTDSVFICPRITYIDLNGGESASRPDNILITDCEYIEETTARPYTSVDLDHGSSASQPDKLLFEKIEDHSDETSVLQLRQFTSVDFNVEGEGNFIYEVEFGPAIQVDFKKRTRAVNQFVFSNDIVYAHLSIQPETFMIANGDQGSKFQLNGYQNIEKTARFMTAAGLVIIFDKDDPKSIYGYAAPQASGKRNEDLLMGLVNHPNHFVINTSNIVNVNIRGGDKDDIFILTGTNYPVGEINGGGGVNSLLIDQEFDQQNFNIDLTSNSPSSCERLDPFLSVQKMASTWRTLKMSNIGNIIGRRGIPDDVEVGCNTKWVDLKQGRMGEDDVIRIPHTLSCTPEMTLMVGRNTRVKNDAQEGKFSYQVDLEHPSDFSSIYVDMEGHAIHNYIFTKNATKITNIQFHPKRGYFQIEFNRGLSWWGEVPVQRSNFYLADQFALELFPEIRGVVAVGANSDQTISGISDYPNLFVLEDTTKVISCNGGHKDDTFLITSEKFSGEIFGAAGNNSVVLADGIWNGSAVIFDGVEQNLSVKKGTVEQKISAKRIQRFFGRVGQSDVAYPGCDTALIDTRGGGNGSTYDLVYVSSSLNCDFDLDTAIRPNLIVINDAREGDFQYEGDFRGGNTSIFLTFSQNADHNVYLAMDFLQLQKLDLSKKEGRLNVTAADQSQFSIDFFIPFGEQIHTQPSIAFQDGLQLKISHHGGYSTTAFGILRNVSSGDIKELEENVEQSSLIQRYQKAAKDTRTNVVMEVKNGTLVSIGSGGRFEILTAVPGYRDNILVCNDADETVYRIDNGTSKVQILVHPDSKGHKVLDLTPIAKGHPNLLPRDIKANGMDVVLVIRNVEITINGRTADESWEDWQVLLRETHLNFKRHYNSFELVPKPFVIDPKKQDTVVLNTTNLERNTEILTAHDPTDPIQYEPVRQDKDLVFTNLFQNQTKSKEVATVVFADYFIQKNILSKNVAFEMEPGRFYQFGVGSEKNLPNFEQLAAAEHGRGSEGPPGVHVKDEL